MTSAKPSRMLVAGMIGSRLRGHNPCNHEYSRSLSPGTESGNHGVVMVTLVNSGGTGDADAVAPPEP
jgi:hypothetical protein